MADHDTLISEFIGVTGVDEERAKFYLESSAWQLEVALAGFYENDGEEGGSPEVIETLETEPPKTPPSKVTTSKSKHVKTASKFATVYSMDSSSSEEEGQAFYAGGSEHSGQQVLGPSKKKDIVAEMFKSVREHGAEVVEPSGPSSHSSSAFSGTGYKLGQTTEDTEVVAGASRKPSHTEVTLKLWREGFSVDDGEIRAYSDPTNHEFLDCVRRGEIPSELIREARGSEIHLNMEDHRHEEFVRVRPRLRPFGGQGHTLGSPAPAAIGAPSETEEDRLANEKQAKAKAAVDKNKPTTNVQIRLADGSRLLGEFNHVHTVDDLRQFIITARPQYQNREFMLLTTFPNRELTDGSQTLAQAGLLNAAVMQRLK